VGFPTTRYDVQVGLSQSGAASGPSRYDAAPELGRWVGVRGVVGPRLPYGGVVRVGRGSSCVRCGCVR
jgi:hypothetical protein